MVKMAVKLSAIIVIMVLSTISANIIADPSRELKTISVIDDMSNTGAFVRHVGTLSTTKSTYKIGLPVSLDSYNDSLKKIENAIRDFFEKYNKTFNPSVWADDGNNGVTSARLLFQVEKTYSRLMSQMSAINSDFQEISKIFNDVPVNSRSPRGLANFVGDAFSWAFGLATEHQLKSAEAKMVQTKNTQVNLLMGEKHLVSVVKTQDLQIYNLEKNQRQILNHTGELILELKKLIFGDAAQNREIMKTTIFERLNHFEEKCSNSLTLLYRKLHNLGAALQATIEGFLSANFFTPDILTDILVEISKDLPAHLMLPRLTNPNSLFELYQLLEAKIEITKNSSKMIVFEVPLINEADIFHIILVTSLEMPYSPRVNATSKLELENNAIYAINSINNATFKINHRQLKSTKKFFSHFYGNFQSWRREDKSIANCILSFRMASPSKLNCKKIITAQSKISTLAHLSGERWAFSVRGKRQVNISCLHESSQFNATYIILEGFGEVQIPPECTITFGRETLTGLFSGYKKIDVPRISKIFQIAMAPANLAFSENWSSFSENITLWDVKNLTNMQKDLNNELGYQIRNTLLHNRTKNLLTKIDSLLNNPQNNTRIPWYHIEQISKKEGILLGLTILSFMLHIFTFFIIQIKVRNLLLKFVRQLT